MSEVFVVPATLVYTLWLYHTLTNFIRCVSTPKRPQYQPAPVLIRQMDEWLLHQGGRLGLGPELPDVGYGWS